MMSVNWKIAPKFFALTCILSIFTLLLSGVSYAARWAKASVDTNGTITYVDLDSLYKTTQGYIGYWSKKLWKNERNIPNGNYTVRGQHVWYTKSLAVEDCGLNLTTESWVEYVHYGLKDDVIASGSVGWPGMSQPVPESVGETIHKFVCWAWDYKQQLTQQPEPQQAPSYFDLTRWAPVYKETDSQKQLVVDTKSIEKCGYVAGKYCSSSMYGQQAQGYKFWIGLADSEGKQIASPVQTVVNCQKRELDGEQIVPQSVRETIYTAICLK